MPSVEWRHSRRQLLHPVAILPSVAAPNPYRVVRMSGLLDTGATGTALHPRVIDELELTRRGQRRVATANGMIFAPEVMVRLGFFVGSLTNDEQDDIATHPHVMEDGLLAFELRQDFGHDVLIGMDVIGQCDLRVSKDGTARLDLP
jgi:predicted aspartyl protease